MKTVRKLIASLPIALSIAGCSYFEEQIVQVEYPSLSTETRSSVSNDSDIYYHEGTGLVLQAYDIFDNPQVFKVNENADAITHLGVKFYPKSIEEQRLLDNSEVANVRYIPFGFTPLVPDDQEWAKDISSLPKFPEISPYVIDTKGYESTEPSRSEPIGNIQLPIMYAVWPIDEPFPNGIEHEVCFKACIPEESKTPATRSFDYGDYVYNIQFISYDALLDDDIPLHQLKVVASYDIYSKVLYTDSNGCVSFVPSTIAGLPTSHYNDLEISIILNSSDWTIVKNSGTTPIHNVIGTTGSLWINPTSGSTFISERTSYSTEYEIHRAVDYYFNTNHTLSQGISSSEHGTFFYALDNSSTTFMGRTVYSPTTDPYIEIANNNYSQNEIISCVLHEIGHARMFWHKGYNGYVSCTKACRESYASFVGWYLGNNYYTSNGFVFPYSWYQINDNNRQDWMPGSGDNYTPFFVDLNDNYNQANLNDPISGVPANVLDYAAMTYSSITDCGTYLYTFVPAFFTSTELTNYLTYYSGL